MKTEKVDVLVIGAGPAGCIAASIVHKEGLNVHIVEKQKFPRFVIGESLLPRCMDHLDEAGLLEDVKQAGFQKKFGAKFVLGDKICDFNFQDQFTKGWTWTYQVPRASFDQVLATGVQKKGIPLDFETGVIDIKFGETSLITTEDSAGNKKQIEAKYIIDASGYGRVIPRMLGLDKASSFDPRKTHFVHFKDPNRPEGTEGNRITVIVHRPEIWIWVIPFSTGITSVGFVGNPEFFKDYPEEPTKRMREIVADCDHLRERFKESEMVFEPRTIEGYAITSSKFYGDGFVTCGNATEFLDPVFSSGVTFAMESGNKAAKLVCKKLKGEPVDWEKDYVAHMMQGINTFRSYVSGWYDGTLHKIFFAKNPKPGIKNQICSVLAGYVWDLENPYVKKHDRALKVLAEVIDL